jgi:hypothetical protein
MARENSSQPVAISATRYSLSVAFLQPRPRNRHQTPEKAAKTIDLDKSSRQGEHG